MRPAVQHHRAAVALLGALLIEVWLPRGANLSPWFAPAVACWTAALLIRRADRPVVESAGPVAG